MPAFSWRSISNDSQYSLSNNCIIIVASELIMSGIRAGVRDGSDEQQIIHCDLGIKIHVCIEYLGQRGFERFTPNLQVNMSQIRYDTEYHIMKAYESCKKLVINISRTNLVRYFRPELPSSYQSFGHFSRSLFVANCKGECLVQRRIAVPFEDLCESSRGYNHVEDY